MRGQMWSEREGRERLSVRHAQWAAGESTAHWPPWASGVLERCQGGVFCQPTAAGQPPSTGSV